MKTKKANMIVDSLIIIIILLVFAFLLPFLYRFMTDYNTSTQASNLSPQAKTTFDTMTTQFPQWTDNAVLAAFILLWIGALVASFLIDSHPSFFVMTIILWIFLLLGMAWISNAYQDVMASSNISTYNAFFPRTAFIMSHLVEFMIALGLTIGVALYAKSR